MDDKMRRKTVKRSPLLCCFAAVAAICSGMVFAHVTVPRVDLHEIIEVSR